MRLEPVQVVLVQVVDVLTPLRGEFELRRAAVRRVLEGQLHAADAVLYHQLVQREGPEDRLPFNQIVSTH